MKDLVDDETVYAEMNSENPAEIPKEAPPADLAENLNFLTIVFSDENAKKASDGKGQANNAAAAGFDKTPSAANHQKFAETMMQSLDYRERAAGRAIKSLAGKDPELARDLTEMAKNGNKERAITLGFAIDSFEGKEFGSDDKERASQKKEFATETIKELLKSDPQKAELFADLACRPFCSINGCRSIKSMIDDDNLQGLNLLRDCLNSPVPNDPRPLPEKPVNYFESGKELMRLFDSHYNDDMKTLLSNVSEKGQIDRTMSKLFYGNRDAYDRMIKGLKSGDESERQLALRIADLPSSAQGVKDLETLSNSLKNGKISSEDFKKIMTAGANNEQVGQLIRLRADSSLKTAASEIFKKLDSETGIKQVQQILDWQTSKFDMERKSGQLAMNLLNSPDEKVRNLPFQVATKVEDMGFRNRLLELAQNPALCEGVNELCKLSGGGVKDRQIFSSLNPMLDSESAAYRSAGQKLLEKLGGSAQDKTEARNILLNVPHPASQVEALNLLSAKNPASPALMEMLNGNAENRHAANKVLEMKASRRLAGGAEEILSGIAGASANENKSQLIALSKLNDIFKMDQAYQILKNNPAHKPGMEKLIASLNEGPEQAKAVERLLSDLSGNKLPSGKLWTNDGYSDREKTAVKLISMLGDPKDEERARQIIKHSEGADHREALLKLSEDHEPSAKRLLSILESPDHNEYALGKSMLDSYSMPHYQTQESAHNIRHLRTLFEIMDTSEGKSNSPSRFPSDNGHTAAILKSGLKMDPTTGTLHLTSLLNDRDKSKQQAGLDLLQSFSKMDRDSASKLLNSRLNSPEKKALAEILNKNESSGQGSWLLNLASDPGQFEEGERIRNNGFIGVDAFLKMHSGSESDASNVSAARDRARFDFVMNMIKSEPKVAESLIRNCQNPARQREIINLLQNGSPEEKNGARNLLKLFDSPMHAKAASLMDHVSERSRPAGEGANKLIRMLGSGDNEQQKAVNMLAAVSGRVETGNFLRALDSPSEAFKTWQNLCSAPDAKSKSTAANMAKAIFAEGLRERQLAERFVNELSPQNYSSHFKLQPYQYETINQLAKEKSPAFDPIVRALQSTDQATSNGAMLVLNKIADVSAMEKNSKLGYGKPDDLKQAKAELDIWMKALTDPAKRAQATQMLSMAANNRHFDELTRLLNDKEAQEQLSTLRMRGQEESVSELMRNAYDAKEMRGILRIMTSHSKAEQDLFQDMKKSQDPNKTNAAAFAAVMIGSPEAGKRKDGERLLATFKDSERIDDLAKLAVIMRFEDSSWVEPFCKKENKDALANMVSGFEESRDYADLTRNAFFRLQGLDEPGKRAAVMQEIEMLNDSRHTAAGLRMLFKYRN